MSVQLKAAVVVSIVFFGLVSLGGCPPQSGSDGGLKDALGGSTGVSGGDTAPGGSDTATDTGGSDTSPGDTTGTDGSGDGDGTTDTGGDTSGTDETDPLDGFTDATFIHKGAGGFLVDTTVGIPSDADFNESSGGIKTEVQLARLSNDGDTVWFTTGDGNGFVAPQLFCIGADGTDIQEFSFPTGLEKLPAEIWPSADGQTCALLIHADGDGFAWSKSVFLLASRASGTLTTLYDARNVQSGENDYVNLQMTGDGGTLYFIGWDTGVIYSLPSTGGTPQTFATPSAFTRTGSVVDVPRKFRINCDGSAMLVLVVFDGPDSSRPQDLYLIDNTGVTQLTNTGDVQYKNDYNWTDMAVSADGRYVVYTRRTEYGQPWLIERMDRVGGGTVTLSSLDTTGVGFQTLLSCDGSVVLAAKGLPNPGGDGEQAPGIFTLDGNSSLQFHDAWVQAETRPVEFTSVSSAGGVYVGQWDTNAFGDKDRLHVWLPGASAFRDGPSVQQVQYKLDSTAATLDVRVTTSGPVTGVRLVGLYDGFESIYQVAEADDAFFTERFGKDMSESADTAGVYEYAVTFDGLTLDDRYRVRIGAYDDTGKNFAYVDFRPVYKSGETYDGNGDGMPD